LTSAYETGWFSFLKRQFCHRKDAFKDNGGGIFPVVGLFLNCPFWRQKHHFKPEKQVHYQHKAIGLSQLPWSDPEIHKNQLGLSISSNE